MSNDIIGAAKPRIDGPDKLSGRARYAADHYPANLTYAYGVFSNIAAGKITDIDVSKAKQQPGVIEIFHHGIFRSCTAALRISPSRTRSTSPACHLKTITSTTAASSWPWSWPTPSKTRATPRISWM